MQFTALDIEGVFLVEPRRFSDDRGFFSETFRESVFERETGIKAEFVQDNFSYSKHRGTVRGLHFQTPPHAQGKLVRCLRGEVSDVVVDARRKSPTFGQHVKVILSAENGHQIWVPAGFLHGFATLTSDCEVAYKVTDYYSKECDGSVRWNDPMLGIDWGITDDEAVLSEKDNVAPLFAEFDNPF